MPQFSKSPNVGSQLERALIAYWYEFFNEIGEKLPNFYFSNDWRERQAPLIDVLAYRSAEHPINTSDEEYMVKFSARWPGANQPGEKNLDYNWVQINRLIGIPMAAFRLSNNNGDFREAAMRISAAGRRLAVFGLNPILGISASSVDDLENNADMATFTCDFLQFKSAERAKTSDAGIILVEERHWLCKCYNRADDSIFPALSFDGNHTLNWTFTSGGIGAEPDFWVVEKTVNGIAWNTHSMLASGSRSENISGTGTQYWRVRRCYDGTTLENPESNSVKAVVT